MTARTSPGSAIEKIVWATDFSKESRFCLPYIKFFAEKLKTDNHAVYVLPKFADWVYETAFFTDDELFETIDSTRRKSLAKIQGAVKRWEIPMQARIVDGLASEALINYAHENSIDMIFAGRCGGSEIEHILIGSTTSRLIRNTDIPIFVIPKNKRTVTIEKVLCPIDFNESSLRDLEFAIGFSRQLNAKLYVVHVSEFFNYKMPVFQRDKLIEGINERILGIAEELDYTIEGIIYEEGEPGQRIIEIARKQKMDVITMATHQRSGIEKFFLGSITEKVLMYSNTPVLILPPGVQ